jgi:hypothetical protein
MIFSRSGINVRMNIPAWEGQEVQIDSEQDAAFTQKDILYLDGRQTKFCSFNQISHYIQGNVHGIIGDLITEGLFGWNFLLKSAE